ncbi:hypothetical protein FSARC_12127 [Fusarium sarcochroum]|uniref:MFS general substrate transporter n=1 Tax=Fusarium sarcochroum TaxID=1208366 RepID=A0A8H4WYG3_9HYPO|nr:hypothetical protein FSARC_12127 [Fusarium sarcochroum]
MAPSSDPSALLSSPPLPVALASFATMFSVGTVYVLSTLQVELPRLLGVAHSWSFAPFGAASLGLSVGVSTCTSMLSKDGPHTVAGKGTILWGLAVASTGFFLSRLSYLGILVSLLVGGVGVGWTYLAIIVTIGHSFPDQPLARSAIGPLGFSSGTAACIQLGPLLNFDVLSAEDLGRIIIHGGVAFIAIGTATALLLSGIKVEVKTRNDMKQASPSLSLSALLFFNALPGMIAFSALQPLAHYYKISDSLSKSFPALPSLMLALAAGGILAPAVSSFLGVRLTFGLLFYLRGLLLVILSQAANPGMALVASLAILFAHGTGFSILPGLVKAQIQSPSQFPYAYGRILVAWGAAGVAATILNGLLVS